MSKILVGKYEKVKKVGQGTFGNVYKCRDTRSGEFVAIKKFKKEYASQEEAFGEREVKAVRLLQHPNIIETKDVLFEKGTLYIVFELCDKNLTQHIREWF